ncbi:hypothetical protein FE633_28410 [Streptomyces montanus]|uniref:Uncharacterized protein n=1 Tax=Streptomyces montanus TaxID=2580423 RepID=A0A5R9FI78_9ACTN|nr:hypothetical protein [Streptomyces montanus]TLS42921.1 hypothetical protein FE633_28410 [Streptomyces montanus]
MTTNVVGQVAWIVLYPGLFYVMVVFTSQAYVLVFVPFILYSLYRFFVQFTYFPWALRMRRILREYPWQVLDAVPSGLGKYPGARDDGIWFEFRNPADPGEKIPLVFIKHQRSYWWLKRMDGPRTKPERRAQIEPLWFAGDPRFLGVIAAPGRGGKAPKRLHVLYQRPVFDSRCASESWGADTADIERARRAGARYLDNAPQPHA